MIDVSVVSARMNDIRYVSQTIQLKQGFDQT